VTKVTEFVGHHGANILVVRSIKIPSIDPTESILVTCGADKSIKLAFARTGEALGSAFSGNLGSILCVAQHPVAPELLAFGSMDGSVGLIHLDKIISGEESFASVEKIHSKPCTGIQFTQDGTTLISGGRDASVHVHSMRDGLSIGNFSTHSFMFPGAIESFVVLPDNETVLVAASNTCFVYFCSLNPTAPKVVEWSMNSNPLDYHQSFVPTHLAISPSGKFVLMATSAASGRVIMWSLLRQGEQWQLHQFRNFYGPKADEYSKPRVCWLGSDAYFAATSDDYKVYIFATYRRDLEGKVMIHESQDDSYLHTNNKQIVTLLNGHAHVVRDFQFCSPYLLTGGFDKSVIIWKVLQS
jgi:WD40 repeat protein